MRTTLTLLSLLLGAGSAWAQESATEGQGSQDGTTQTASANAAGQGFTRTLRSVTPEDLEERGRITGVYEGSPAYLAAPEDYEAAFYATLDSDALVLKKYNQTLINVYGHTDSTGSDQYNQALSQRRANAVSSYLATQGVSQQRMIAQGFGESRPIADNGSEAGRAQNRRVEIQIVPLT